MKNIKHVAFLIRRTEDLLEGCRSSLGLAIENFFVHMFVLGVEIEMTQKYRDHLDWFEDMEARRYSDRKVNAERWGFEYVTLEAIGEKLKEMDLIIPF
jgi:hypothetical protein